MLTAIRIKMIPVITSSVPMTTGGNSARILPMSGLNANRMTPPSMMAVLAPARLEALAIATIAPM
jgi:hypothetical protein